MQDRRVSGQKGSGSSHTGFVCLGLADGRGVVKGLAYKVAEQSVHRRVAIPVITPTLQEEVRELGSGVDRMQTIGEIAGKFTREEKRCPPGLGQR